MSFTTSLKTGIAKGPSVPWDGWGMCAVMLCSHTGPAGPTRPVRTGQFDPYGLPFVPLTLGASCTPARARLLAFLISGKKGLVLGAGPENE